MRTLRAALAVTLALLAATVTALPSAAATPGWSVAAGTGRDTPSIAAFRSGTWYVRTTLTSGSADLCFVFGQAGDQPVVGDWDGDGLKTPGVFRSSTGTWFLSNSPYAQSGADVVLGYGSPGDIAYPGDWNNDAVDTVGIYRPGDGQFYLRNSNTSGKADGVFRFGQRGDQPAPYWRYPLAVFRPSNGTWYGAQLESPTPAVRETEVFGQPGDIQASGSWYSIFGVWPEPTGARLSACTGRPPTRCGWSSASDTSRALRSTPSSSEIRVTSGSDCRSGASAGTGPDALPVASG